MPYGSSISWYASIDKAHGTNHGSFSYLKVMPGMYDTSKSYVCVATDCYRVMPLSPAMTGEINTIRNDHMVFNNHVFGADIIKIAFHAYKSTPQF